jgi:hypothetical protein
MPLRASSATRGLISGVWCRHHRELVNLTYAVAPISRSISDFAEYCAHPEDPMGGGIEGLGVQRPHMDAP